MSNYDNPGSEVHSGLDSASSLPGGHLNASRDLFGQPLSKTPTALHADHPLLKPESLSGEGTEQADPLTGLPQQNRTISGHGYEFESGIAPIDYTVHLAGKALDAVDQVIESGTPAVKKIVTDAVAQISESVHDSIDTAQKKWNAPDNELRSTLNNRLQQAIGFAKQKMVDLSADPEVKEAVTAVTRLSHTVAEKTKNFVEMAQSATEDWVDRAFDASYLDKSPSTTSGSSDRSKSPFVGVIDTGFEPKSHGAQIVDAIQQAGKRFPDWLGDGVGTGDWADSLVQFVDAAKASGQAGAVVNLSFDLTQINPDGSVSTRYELTSKEYTALAYAQDNNVLLVVSTGNQGSQMSALGKASQAFNNIIAVGAVENGQRADYSSYGAGVDVVASGKGKGDVEGTSLSAARVTGAIAQIWKANPALNYQQVIQTLEKSATDLQDPGVDQYTGVGKLNLDRAVEIAEGGQVGKGYRLDVQETPIIQPNHLLVDDASIVPGERPTFLGELKDTVSSGWDAFKENVAEPIVELLPEPAEEFVRNVGNTAEETVSGIVNDPGSTPEILQDAASDISTAVEGLAYPGYVFQYEPGRELVYDAMVEKWQARMQERGWNIAVDGYYGAHSAEVARQFQAEKGLTADGIVGSETWAASFNTRNEVDPAGEVARGGLPVGVAGTGEENSRVFSYEPGQSLDYNPYVEQWQQRMRERGWNIEVDGYYGEHSAEVARQFQEEKGLVVDGVVGERTWEEAFRTDNITSSSSGSSVGSGLLASYGEPLSSATPDSLYSQYSGQMTENRDLSDNMRAFLDTISYAEGTYAPDGYRIRFGGDRFDSFADHPRIHEPFRDTTSTAAGRYQFIQGTWDGVRSQLELPDFSPQSQDLAAVQLIKNRGAYEDVEAGRFESAVAKVSKEWASFPGAGYNQPEKNLTDLKQFYEARLQQFEEVFENSTTALPTSETLQRQDGIQAPDIDSLSSNRYQPFKPPLVPDLPDRPYLPELSDVFDALNPDQPDQPDVPGRKYGHVGGEQIYLQRYNSEGELSENFEAGKETIVITHGNTGQVGSDHIRRLLTAIAKQNEHNPDVQVIGLDWSKLADDSQIFGSGPGVNLDQSSQWMASVARKARQLLEDIGIKPDQLTLIGHSYGAYVSSEIAKDFGGVKNLVALDPATIHPGFDLDKFEEGEQEPVRFRDVATNSLAFVVEDDNDLASSQELAATAEDSLVVNFEANSRFGLDIPPSFTTAHTAVVDVFTDAIQRGFLTVQQDFALPNHTDDSWNDHGHNTGGNHEGEIIVSPTNQPKDGDENPRRIEKLHLFGEEDANAEWKDK